MKTDRNLDLPGGAEPPKSPVNVLGQSVPVEELVKARVEELALPPGVESALEKSAAVEAKAQRASEQLAVVNRALESEVRGRQMLEHQFAAATEQEQAARHAAFHDVLTGLPNRALFNDRLEHGLAQARRHGRILAVMFIDLDGFKIINDTHGHDAGDRVLQTIAARLKENTRGDDTVSRFGGDEFLYLLAEIRDAQSIALIAEKIIKAIQAPCNVRVSDSSISPGVGASIGISIFPKDGATAEALIRSADTAMYRAKQGKAGYAFAR